MALPDGTIVPYEAITDQQAAQYRVGTGDFEDEEKQGAWADPEYMKELDSQAIDQDGALYYSNEETPDYDHTLDHSISDWATDIEGKHGTLPSEYFKEGIVDGVSAALAHHPDIQTRLMPNNRLRLYCTRPRNTRYVDLIYDTPLDGMTDGHALSAMPGRDGTASEPSYTKRLWDDKHPYEGSGTLADQTEEFMSKAVRYVDGK
jgi:hypothetical protein